MLDVIIFLPAKMKGKTRKRTLLGLKICPFNHPRLLRKHLQKLKFRNSISKSTIVLYNINKMFSENFFVGL